ncbi:HAD-like domain-containing protein [Phlyctochytrium arcticum]|nr:HAD-like domain-containing protein [Phlyctochytrium arcticum]
MDVSQIKLEDVHLVVSDVDGTLLDSAHKLHPRTRDAILNLRKHHPHIPFVVATGKPHAAVSAERAELGLGDLAAIHLNGSLIYNGQELMREDSLSIPLIQQILEKGRQLGTQLFIYVQNNVYEVIHDPTGRDGKSWIDVLAAYGEDVRAAPEGLLDKVLIGEVKAQKMVFLAAEENIPGVQAMLDSFPASSFNVMQALPFAIEAICSTSSKGTALQILIDELNINPKNVLAFGDGGNDADMLALVGYGVAMANGMEAALTSAKYRTLSNDEGGVGFALEQIFKF